MNLNEARNELERVYRVFKCADKVLEAISAVEAVQGQEKETAARIESLALKESELKLSIDNLDAQLKSSIEKNNALLQVAEKNVAEAMAQIKEEYEIEKAKKDAMIKEADEKLKDILALEGAAISSLKALKEEISALEIKKAEMLEKLQAALK